MASLQLIPSSSPPTTPNRLRRRGTSTTPPNSTQRFSRLLSSVLGSPFLTTTDLATLPPHLDLVDGDDAIVPHAETVTRPPSPEGLYGFEFVHREDGRGPDDQWPFRRASPFRSLLPRIWDVISSSPPRPLPPPKLMMIDYARLPPLDGEEGELIDDEACFFCPPVKALVTGIDILTLLPPELSLHILLLLLPSTRPDPRAAAPTLLGDFPDHSQDNNLSLSALLSCRAVSRKWSRLASDNAIWRAAYFTRWGPPSTPLSLPPLPTLPTRPSLPPRSSSLGRMKKLPALPPDAPPDYSALYRARLALDRRWATPDWEPRATALSGHTDSVYCLEFSSTHIITGSRDRAVKVWSLRTGALLGTFAGTHSGSVLCLKFELDPATRRGVLVTGSSDCTVCVWDLWYEPSSRTGADDEMPVHAEVRDVLQGHVGGVLDLRLDERWIVSCSKDTTIRVWERETRKLHRTLRGHDGPVNAVGLQSGHYTIADDAGPHGGRVVSASGDGKMILWDIASGERVRTFEGHDRGLACIEFKGDLIVSGSNDCKIKLWSASSGACLRTLVGHEALVRALSVDVRAGRLVSASYDKSVRVWDLGTGKVVRIVRESHTSHIFDVKFDERRIVSTGHDRRVVVLDFGLAEDGHGAGSEGREEGGASGSF
ncbi:WD-repeats-region domain-containing protein [Favolaschia claudopus]|uniref:WD-repeats-region domain-containing protein n=1 Tax=Favolaschia claudopus TaxID=2862362 RepID=A0AAW0CQT2_9AGAR